MGVGIIADEFEVPVFEPEDILHFRVDLHGRQGSQLSAELQFCLLQVIGIQVCVPKCVYKFPWLQVANLRNHHREKCIGSDIKRNSQKYIRASLVELAGQLAIRDIKLKHRVARGQGHLVHVGDVPGTYQVSSAVGLGLDLVDQVFDLVDLPAFSVRPMSPLIAIDRSQIAVFIRPFVPDGYAVFLQPGDVAFPPEKPQQLDDDGAEVQFFGRDHREALGEIKPHLMSENAGRSGAGPVGFLYSFMENSSHQVVILLHGLGENSRLAS